MQPLVPGAQEGSLDPATHSGSLGQGHLTYVLSNTVGDGSYPQLERSEEKKCDPALK